MNNTVIYTDRSRYIESQRKKATKHGMRYTVEYMLWAAMRRRCSPTHPAGYAVRGIRVCPEWKDFTVFLAHVGKRPSADHSLDRIDNDKGYEPGNVRWATWKQQNRNTRWNRVLTVDGISRSVAEWVEASGLSRHTIKGRLSRGWSEKEAVTVPYRLFDRWNKRLAQ